MAGTCKPWCSSSQNGNTHTLGVKSVRDTLAWLLLIKYKYALPDDRNVRRKSAMIMVLLMKFKCALPVNQKWQEQVKHDGPAQDMWIRTRCESKVAGTCQPWLCWSWNINTHFLIIRNGGNMSAVIMLVMKLMKWHYAPTERQKWQENVSHDCVPHEI